MKTELPIYQIDAFADHVFGGNPASVCPLEEWLPDSTLQAIARENNQAETAFFAPEGDRFRLRWFTPVAEVDLCGHATLASADVLFRLNNYPGDVVRFVTRSGQLTVSRDGDMYAMDFPATMPQVCDVPDVLVEALGVVPLEMMRGFDYVVVVASEADVRALAPNMHLLRRLDLRGLVVTSRGETVDFVSRFFAPGVGIDEDPVTGSAHCELAPYWAGVLGKSSFVAQQLSPRGGTVWCELHGDRVTLRGRAAHYLAGRIRIV